MTVNVSRGGANLPQKPTPAPNMCWEEIHYFIIYFDYFLDGTNTSNEGSSERSSWRVRAVLSKMVCLVCRASTIVLLQINVNVCDTSHASKPRFLQADVLVSPSCTEVGRYFCVRLHMTMHNPPPPVMKSAEYHPSIAQEELSDFEPRSVTLSIEKIMGKLDGSPLSSW